MVISTEKYYKLLVQKAKRNIEVTSLEEFINAIAAIMRIYKKVVFRGQADINWGIESSAYRKLNKPTQKQLQDYHLNLLSEVKKLHDIEKYDNIEMLAHLQHNGAKTILIDYTLNPLVALWFACFKGESEENNGAVFCLQNDTLVKERQTLNENIKVEEIFSQSDVINFWDPPRLNHRIMSQQSIFLFSASGKIDYKEHIIITIHKDNKKYILNQLSTIGISRKTLFPDFQGFIGWYDYDDENGSEKYDEFVEKANKFYEEYDFINALDFYNKALEISIKLFGEESAITAATYNNIAVVYRNQGKYEMALEWFNKALVIREKVLGKDHPSTAATYDNIASVYDNQSEYDKALELFNKALLIRKKVLGEGYPYTASTYNNIALVYSRQGKYDKALELYNKALAIVEKALGKGHPDTATTYNNIAGVYYNQCEYKKALEWYDKALAIYEKVLGNEHPSTVRVRENRKVTIEKI